MEIIQQEIMVSLEVGNESAHFLREMSVAKFRLFDIINWELERKNK